ncbi:MAG: hypothetical protein ACI8W7_000480 [Gammaproteobacteria bacterium]
MVEVVELLLLGTVHCFIPRMLAPASGCAEKVVVMSHTGYFCCVAASFNNPLHTERRVARSLKSLSVAAAR